MTDPWVCPGACRTVSSTPASESTAPSSSGLHVGRVGQPHPADQRGQRGPVPARRVAEHPEVVGVQVGGDVVAVADRQHGEGVVEVPVGEHDGDRLQAVVGQHAGQRLDGVHAGVDDDALLPGSGGDGVAVGAERAGGEGADEHPCRLRGRPAPPVLPGNAQPRRLDSPSTAGRACRSTSGAAPPDAPARSRSSTVPTNKQRRQAAQRHLQRSWSAAPSWPASAGATCGIGATVVAVAVVVGRGPAASPACSAGNNSTQRRGRQRSSSAAQRTAAADHQRRRHGLLRLHPRHVGQHEPQGRRHAAQPGGDAHQGHRDAEDDHQPGRPRR